VPTRLGALALAGIEASTTVEGGTIAAAFLGLVTPAEPPDGRGRGVRERFGASTLLGQPVRIWAMRRLALFLALATGCTPIPVGTWTPREPRVSARTAHPEIYTECEAFIGFRQCRLAEVKEGRASDSEYAKVTQALRAMIRQNTAPQSPAASSSPARSGDLFWGQVAQSALTALLKPFTSSR
jgi:hypothetical protein